MTMSLLSPCHLLVPPPLSLHQSNLPLLQQHPPWSVNGQLLQEQPDPTRDATRPTEKHILWSHPLPHDGRTPLSA